jgi:hypothetical protein
MFLESYLWWQSFIFFVIFTSLSYVTKQNFKCICIKKISQFICNHRSLFNGARKVHKYVRNDLLKGWTLTGWSDEKLSWWRVELLEFELKNVSRKLFMMTIVYIFWCIHLIILRHKTKFQMYLYKNNHTVYVQSPLTFHWCIQSSQLCSEWPTEGLNADRLICWKVELLKSWTAEVLNF